MALKKHEEYCATLRDGPRAYASRIAFGLLWVMTPFLFFFPLLRLGWFGVLVVIVLFIGGFWYLSVLRARWWQHTILVTTERCVDSGQSFSWRDVRHVACVKRPRFFYCISPQRDVRIVLKHGPVDIVLCGLESADRVVSFLRAVQSAYSQKICSTERARGVSREPSARFLS